LIDESRVASPEGQDRIVVLGKIVGTFGVQGWIKVSSYTEPAANILEYETWQMGRAGRWTPVKVEDGRVTGKGVLAKLAGLETPEAARIHIGAELGVRRSELPPTPQGEYYWSDLEGLDAFAEGGQPLGVVDHFRGTPGGVIVVVKGEREHWIPFVKERILKVDLDARRIVLDWAADW
jgi:16S rRNA processing protein RimM